MLLITPSPFFSFAVLKPEKPNPAVWSGEGHGALLAPCQPPVGLRQSNHQDQVQVASELIRREGLRRSVEIAESRGRRSEAGGQFRLRPWARQISVAEATDLFQNCILLSPTACKSCVNLPKATYLQNSGGNNKEPTLTPMPQASWMSHSNFLKMLALVNKGWLGILIPCSWNSHPPTCQRPISNGLKKSGIICRDVIPIIHPSPIIAQVWLQCLHPAIGKVSCMQISFRRIQDSLCCLEALHISLCTSCLLHVHARFLFRTTSVGTELLILKALLVTSLNFQVSDLVPEPTMLWSKAPSCFTSWSSQAAVFSDHPQRCSQCFLCNVDCCSDTPQEFLYNPNGFFKSIESLHYYT